MSNKDYVHLLGKTPEEAEQMMKISESLHQTQEELRRRMANAFVGRPNAARQRAEVRESVQQYLDSMVTETPFEEYYVSGAMRQVESAWEEELGQTERRRPEWYIPRPIESINVRLTLNDTSASFRD